MATVHLARDLKHDRDVAVKLLNPDISAALGADRFAQEIRLTAGLQHANILPLFDSGSADGQVFYVMPFVSGGTLRSRLARGPIPVSDGVAILRDVARALGYAHSHGVVHRDIKPENVLLGGGAAIVSDFGIAKAIAVAQDDQRRTGDRSARTALTQAGTSLGTPAYMAPEQALGDVVDARTDVYAWGVMAYEVFAGAHPFAAHTAAQRLVAAQVSETPAPIDTLQPALPPELAALVMNCLAKDRADRPADGNEIVARISSVTTPVPHPSARPQASRRPLVAWIVAAVLITIGVSVGALAFARRGGGGGRATPSARTVVVVPFENKGNPADAYFAEGVSDEIAGQLARLPGLAVIGREGVLQFRSSGQSAREIGKRMGAAFVLSGSVRWAHGAQTGSINGDTRVVIAPVLTDVATGTQRWGESFEERLTDVFQVQANVAERVASSLSVTLGTAARRTLHHEESVDPDARDAELLGRYLLRQRGLDNLRRAEESFEHAISRDPNYARAWAGLAEALVLRPQYYDTTEAVDAFLARADSAARRAVALDSTLPEVQLALARTRSGEFRFREALDAVNRALALDSNATLSYALKYEVLTALGRYDEAGDASRRALELDALSALALNDRATWFWSGAMFDSATYYAERAVAIAPNEVQWKRSLWTIMASAGRLKEAVALCEASFGRDLRCSGTLTALAGSPGNHAAQLVALGSVGRLAGVNGFPAFAALAYARLGMADSVFSRLRTAVDRHDDTFTHLITNRVFEPFHADPRWDAIVGAVRRR